MPSFDLQSHSFTPRILEILSKRFGRDALEVLKASPLLGYLNLKTRSANRGSKARGAFANHYALYVLVEDYITKGFASESPTVPYSKYEGARFSDLFRRQRELPFGAKLQNHALNARLNDEFHKYYPTVGKPPIVREVDTQRYWIHEDLLKVDIRGDDGKKKAINIAEAVIEIIDAYVSTKKAAFEGFLAACQDIAALGTRDPEAAVEFVRSQLQPEVDARVFEIVSFAVLKAKYGQQRVWIGGTRDTVAEEGLVLFKTGRTNANDGGIDFVMRPLGRFFQVTETVDVGKYFLDIDKVQRFPIAFVVKTDLDADAIRAEIREQAIARYKIEAVVDSYLAAVEEIINVPDLVSAFDSMVAEGLLQSVMDEIVAQSKVEFNYSEAGPDGED